MNRLGHGVSRSHSPTALPPALVKSPGMPRYVAAIDQGTTSTRCILFDRAGLPVASAQKEHKQIYPRPGWVEHDPAEIWARTQSVVADAVAKARAAKGDIAAVGITNQR